MNITFIKTIRILSVAASVAISLASFTAQAEEGTAEQRQACMSDAFRLCSSHIPNVPAITACMTAKKAQLSPGCRLVFNKPPAKPTKALAANDYGYNRDQ